MNRTNFLVLLALSHGPAHGYEIAKFIDEKSRGFFRVPFGSLYPVLHKLEKDRLVKAKWDQNDSEKPRKIYQLSELGKKELQAEIDNTRSSYKALNAMIPASF